MGLFWWVWVSYKQCRWPCLFRAQFSTFICKCGTKTYFYYLFLLFIIILVQMWPVTWEKEEVDTWIGSRGKHAMSWFWIDGSRFATRDDKLLFMCFMQYNKRNSSLTSVVRPSVSRGSYKHTAWRCDTMVAIFISSTSVSLGKLIHILASHTENVTKILLHSERHHFKTN